MTDTLARLVELERQATPGPWNLDALKWLLRFGRKQDGPWDDVLAEQDGWLPDDDAAALIVALRNAAPALLRVVEAARAVLNNSGPNLPPTLGDMAPVVEAPQ